MKKAVLYCIIIFVTVTGVISLSSLKKAAIGITQINNGIVVLELFTSQGCSSCPSADELVGTYRNNPNIITLSFHVDYWNRLGWVDTFSNAAYSLRQKNYAQEFNQDGVYTPQLVVNGTTAFVGSDKEKLDAAINNFSSEKNISSIAVTGLVINEEKLIVKFKSTDANEPTFYSIALVQTEAATYIKHGENRGVTLKNFNIVRDLVKLPKANETKEQNAVLQLPKGFNKNFFSIVILEQNNNGKIIAAIKSKL